MEDSSNVFLDLNYMHLCCYVFQVNNAGVNYNLGSDNTVEFAETVISTNYQGTKNMTKAMIPLMRPSPHGARVVNVSSRLGRVNGRRNVRNSFTHIFDFF